MARDLLPSDPPVQFLDDVAYTDEGSGEVAVVAVPGLPGSSRDYRWLATPLAEHCRVIRIDPPGYGASPRTDWSGMTTSQRAEPVLALADALGLDRFVLAGHSAGGAVVAHLACQVPDRVSAAVMISSTGPTAHLAKAPMQFLASPLRLSAVRAVAAPAIRQLYAMQGFPTYLTDDERAFALLDAASFDFGEHRANLAAMRSPTLVAWAIDDPVIPRRTFEALASMVPPGPRLEFTDGGHNPQKTHATTLAAAITQFAGEAP